MESKKLYEEKGQVMVVESIIALIVGVGVATMVIIFIGSLGGQTWELVESDVDAITNTTIKNSIKNGVLSGFQSLEQTGKFLPLIVLAVVIALILGLILSFTQFGSMGRGGSVL